MKTHIRPWHTLTADEQERASATARRAGVRRHREYLPYAMYVSLAEYLRLRHR